MYTVVFRDTRTPDTHCPYCGLLINGAAYAGNEVPFPGDPSMCIRCGEISEFGPDMTLRPLTVLSQLKPEEIKKAKDLRDKMKAGGWLE